MEPNKLKIGMEYKIPSGLGGIFPVEYKGLEDDKHLFVNLNQEFKRVCPRYLLDDESVESRIRPADRRQHASNA